MTMNDSPSRHETVTHLAALAMQLENAGQYNLAKLTRASVDALIRRAAYESLNALPDDALVAQVEREMENLSALGMNDALVSTFQRGLNALRAGRLPLMDETPHPFVCRTCGHVAVAAPTQCPTCGAWAVTFQKFPPVYWLDALDTFDALAQLRQTPREVSALLDGLDESKMTQRAPDGGWSIQQIITHMRDAQGVLDFRMGLILTQENPQLEALAVFEWANRADENPPTTRELFNEYVRVREKILAQLESIPLAAWWRTGQHLEFGEVTLNQQVSYFASHELTHLPQIQQLRSNQK